MEKNWNWYSETYLLEKTKVTELEYDGNLEWNIVRVYPSIIKHRWIGMGGSITEFSCYNYNILPIFSYIL